MREMMRRGFIILFILVFSIFSNTADSKILCSMTHCPPPPTDTEAETFCVEFQKYYACTEPIVRTCPDEMITEDERQSFYLENSSHELVCKFKDKSTTKTTAMMALVRTITPSRHCKDPMCHTPTEPYTDVQNCQSQRSYIACMYPYYTHCEKLTEMQKKDFYSRSNEVSKYCAGSDEAYCPADFPLQIRMCFAKLGFGILAEGSYTVKNHEDNHFLIDLNIRNMSNVCRYKTYNEALECTRDVIKTCKDKQTVTFLNKFINVDEQRRAFEKFCAKEHDWAPHLDCIDQQGFGLSVCFQNAMSQMHNDMKHRQVDTTNNEENIEWYTQLLCRYSKEAIECSRDAFSHCSDEAADTIVTLFNENISGPCGINGCDNAIFELSVLLLSCLIRALLSS